MIAHRKPSVMLLDIEGTTTPISFVYETLFPYARTHMQEFLREHEGDEDLRRDIAKLAAENQAEASSSAPVISAGSGPVEASNYLLWLMDQDRKSPALKSIQGMIWEAGYTSGQLKSLVFADVPSALERWHCEGRRIAIYSSGSVLAQKLLFRHSEAGDLTEWIAAYFDTATGAKAARDSYRKIAQALGVRPEEILFLSDVPAELDAAASAGLDVRLAKRPGNREVPQHVRHLPVLSFDEL
jgi:enolase-phosphatase E1